MGNDRIGDFSFLSLSFPKTLIHKRVYAGEITLSTCSCFYPVDFKAPSSLLIKFWGTSWMWAAEPALVGDRIGLRSHERWRSFPARQAAVILLVNMP
jgi:hypothetical protein